MTAQEMVEILNKHGNENFSFCCELEELIDNGSTTEAIDCIREHFDCDEYLANQCLIEFEKQIYTEFKRIENEDPLSPEQIARANAVAREWQNKPKCPTCQSQNLKKISATSKAVNTAVWGIFGTKRHKTFHCNNCGYEW